MVALLILIPLLSVLAILMAPQGLTKPLAIGASLINLGIAITAIVIFQSAPSDFNESGWTVTGIPALSTEAFTINLSFGLTGISAIMLLLSTLVCLAATLSGKAPAEGVKTWYVCSLLIAAGAIGAFLSLDLFFFYAFHELALLPTFIMIGMYGRGERKNIAWKATIYLAVGSIILLAGLVWLANIAGTYQISALANGVKKALATAPAEGLAGLKCQLTSVAALLIIGYGTLVSLFPFHSWAAPAYASAPAPVAMLHAGVLKKFGLYGLIITGLQVIPEFMKPWLCTLLILLLGNIIWVGLVTINQRRIDTMLGNSSVMHMGYIFLAIAAYIAYPDSSLAIPAATLLMFAHGISIAMSFSLTDVIERKTGTLEFNQLGGLAKTAPNLAFLFGLVGMASIGLPGLANFAGEIMVFFSGFEPWKNGEPLGWVQYATMIAIWGVVISAVYLLRAFKAVFHGQLAPSTKDVEKLTLLEKTPAILLGAVLLAVGVYPNLILQLIL